MFWPTLILVILILLYIALAFIRGTLEYLALNRAYIRVLPQEPRLSLRLSVLYQQLIDATKIIEESLDNAEYLTMFRDITELWSSFLYYLGMRFIPQHIESTWFWGVIFILSPIASTASGLRWLTTKCVRRHEFGKPDPSHACFFST